MRLCITSRAAILTTKHQGKQAHGASDEQILAIVYAGIAAV